MTKLLPVVMGVLGILAVEELCVELASFAKPGFTL